jgi:hypothetical protein
MVRTELELRSRTGSPTNEQQANVDAVYRWVVNAWFGMLRRAKSSDMAMHASARVDPPDRASANRLLLEVGSLDRRA